jgi:hypothetical protein
MAEAKIGDIFRHVKTGELYRLYKIVTTKYSITYEFMDLQLKQPWSLGKKKFMRDLKPAPEVARILYANT